MCDEEHRSSFAPTAAGGRPQRELPVPASILIGGHEEPQERASVSTSNHA
jgi:hypothetical protein